MTRISISGLKYAAFASHETSCFEAVVCLDGKPMFHASNDGHGGADLYVPLPKQGGAEFQKAYASVDAVARAEAPQFFHGICGDGGHAYSLGIEALIGTLVNDELTVRDLRRHLKSKVLFRTPDQKGPGFRTMKAPKGRLVSDAVAFVKERHADALILNTLPEVDALSAYVQHG